MKISDIRNELNRINMHENPIEIPGTAKEMLQGAGVMENDKLIPLQNIDSIIAQDGAKSNCGKPWFNTIPFGTPSDTFPYLLAVCRGKSTLPGILRKIKGQCSKIVKKYPGKDTEKIVVLLTDKWDTNTFEKYDKVFLNHALKDNFSFIILLVTEYGYTQIPFLPNDRHMLDSCRGEKIEDDLSMDDIYRYLKDYPFEYHFSTTLDKYGNTEYIFNVEYMTWEKHSFREHCVGHISRRSLNALVKKLCWIIDSKENSISFYNSKDNFFKLKIFGKTVEWDFIPEYEEKNIKELPVAIRKFIEACEKHKE